jgi:hypothetical protein
MRFTVVWKKKHLMKGNRMQILEVSRQKAERCEAWTPEDHFRLMEHLRKIDDLAKQIYDAAQAAKKPKRRPS